MNHFAERLRQTRTLRKLSQAALAKACGLSQSAIANYENGNRKMAKDIFGLAEALHVNPGWLAQGTGPMEPIPKLELQTHALHRVNESPLPHSAAWPFQNVSFDEYQSLPEESRLIIERTLASLIKSLLNN